MTNIYDRLYQNHTASSRAKRQPGAERVHVAPSAYDHPHTSTPTKATTPSSPSTTTTTTKTTTQTTGVATSDGADKEGDGDDEEDDDEDRDPLDTTVMDANASTGTMTVTHGTTPSAVDPPPPASQVPLPQIILHERDKTYTQTLTPSSLQISSELLVGLPHQDKAVLEQLAYQIIEGLFRRDFYGCNNNHSMKHTGKHWDVDCATVHCLSILPVSAEHGDGYTDEKDASSSGPRTTTLALFAAEQSATWDWKDIYSVAQAKGKIRFTTPGTTIHVEDYNYYVAG
jgi:hypothetical protein